MTSSELESRNIALSMRKSVENLVISSQDAIGQSISQALTFSGVITHHTTQILQENRSISRSPSPSLRISDTTADQVENDKSCESLSCGVAGDNVSVSSSDLPLAVPRPEILRSVSQTSTKTTDAGGARTKKKSWYNSLYPTYKSKSDDFKRLFKDLPDEERLIVDYSCALQKDILAHGRLYASQNYLCFYANIFGWETNMTLRWKEVTAITKEKTALVIPNAILVCTEGEKNFLTSFSGRDKAYLMLFRVWQNALMDQPMSSQEIWQWVHSCYGEELGFNSDDEEYCRELPDEVAVLPLIDPGAEDLIDSSCMEAGEPREDHRNARSASQARDSSPPLVSNGDGAYREEAGDTLPTDMSDSSDSEPDNKHNGGEAEKCTNPHDGKLIMQAQFSFNIDQLFTMIFTNSKFNLELLAARNITDYVQSPWQAQNGLKCRQISYTMGLTTAGPIGPKEVHITETQVMNKCSKPGQLYSIDCTSENAGIPYADYFTVNVHYCLQRVRGDLVQLCFYGQVHYKKNMWPMVKTFLEKNSMNGLQDFCRLMESRLHAEAETSVPTARKTRRHRRLTASNQEVTVLPVAKSPAPYVGRAPRAASSSTPRWLVAAVVALLALNVALYWRLCMSAHREPDLTDLQNRLSSMASLQTAEWGRLLERHSARQRDQLATWRDVLRATVTHLAQTEQALTKLLESIKPSLEKAQQEATDKAEL